MTSPRNGPICSKCGKPVLAEQNYRLHCGEVEHRSCDKIEPKAEEKK